MERNTLKDYQHKAIHKLSNSLEKYRYGFLFFPMRGRKTRTSLYIIKKLSAKVEVKTVLVLCPPAVISTWHKEITKVQGLEGLSIHVDSIGKLSRKSLAKGFDVMVVDEVHNFRSWSKRSQSLARAAKKCKYRLGMTGTPADSSLLELYVPLKCLCAKDKGPLAYTNSRQWRNDWGLCDNPYSKFPKYELNESKKDLFYQELSKISYIHDPDMVAPPEMEIVDYDLLPEQRSVIRALKRGSTECNGEKITLRKEVVAINNACVQICSGFLYERDKTLFFKTNKYRAILDLVNKIQGKVVLWYCYNEEKLRLSQIFPHGVVFSPGQVIGEDVRVVICHPLSAGAGIDLSQFDASIYCSVGKGFVAHKQSEYRIAGQDKVAKINYVMCARQSIEMRYIKSMARKEKEFVEFYKRGTNETICMDKQRQE